MLDFRMTARYRCRGLCFDGPDLLFASSGGCGGSSDRRVQAKSASHVSTPATLKRTMRPFCRCTMRRPSATSSSARRRSFAEPIYPNNAKGEIGAGLISFRHPSANSGPGGRKAESAV